MSGSGQRQMRTSAHRWFACLLAITAVVAGAAAPAVQAEPGNLVINPKAQTGLEGWTATGWSAVAFGSSSNVPAEPAYAVEGTNLFQADVAGATMTQDVSLARDATGIDAGKQPVSASAKLGAAGGGDEGAEMVLQPENGSGEPLGAALTVGPPTAADRDGKAALVSCWINFTAPVGMRSVLVTIEATGAGGQPSTAMADSISVSEYVFAVATIGGGGAVRENCLVPGPGELPPGGGIALATPLPKPAHHEPSAIAKQPLTRTQKLAQALRACKKIRHDRKRKACVRAARTRYGQRPSSSRRRS